MVPLDQQMGSFFITVGAGLVMGLIYDFYCLLRNRLQFRRVATGVGDLVFWTVTTILTFGLLLVANWGEVRLYVFLGMAAGLGIYLRWLTVPCRRTASVIARTVQRCVRFLILIVIWPFQVLHRLVLIPLGILVTLAGRLKQALGIMKRAGRRTGGKVKRAGRRAGGKVKQACGKAGGSVRQTGGRVGKAAGQAAGRLPRTARGVVRKFVGKALNKLKRLMQFR